MNLPSFLPKVFPLAASAERYYFLDLPTPLLDLAYLLPVTSS